MNLKLTAPLAVLDTETTGTKPKLDRVIEIAILKYYPDGHFTSWQSYINPGEPIPEEAIAIHGITDEKVLHSPSFEKLAPTIFAGLKGCDIGGFNVGFDTQILDAEFARVNVPSPFTTARVVDAYRLFCHIFKRDLSAAVERFLGRKHEGAHGAMADTMAAAQVIDAMLQQHLELPQDVEGLHRLVFETISPGYVDPEGKFYWRHGAAYVGFGKEHLGRRLDQVPAKYLNWMMNADFSPHVKKIVEDALNGKYPKKE